MALLLFLVTLPIQLLAALAILLTSGGHVFFRQVRCGLNGRHFTLLKFRTMAPGAEDRLSEISHLNEMTGPVFKARRDPRLTAVGRSPAAALDRRATAALERDRRGHEPGRSRVHRCRRRSRTTSPGSGAGSA